jgi:hypothetical protein
MPADLLARVRAEIEGRLAELRPAVLEYERLLGAAEALALSPGAPAVRPSSPAPPSSDERAPEQPSVTESGDAQAPPPPRPGARARPRARPAAEGRQGRIGAVERAIVAALEHGSHTLAELGVVTAMSGAELREGLRRLLAAGKIVRASREGRAAYALSGGE